jgi:4'-phosphopantetheinyl transferase EntD
MNPPFMHIITVSDTFTAHVKTTGRQPCSIPVLFDISALGDGVSLDETHYKSWLSAEERQQLHQYTLAKRRSEWLAGRICAKAAIADFFRTHCRGLKIPVFAEMTIVNSDTGRPCAILAGGKRLPEGPDISISHSGSLALALAAQTCCGVDIQKTSKKLIRVKERFCTDQEERLLFSEAWKNDQLMPLALLWAAKEAAKKALSMAAMPGFLDLVLACIEKMGHDEFLFIFRNQHRHACLPLEIQVAVACFQTYALGICIP